MILTDANILLYAYNQDAADHKPARTWLEDQLSAPDFFCLSWQTITAFLRISTNARAFRRPLSIKDTANIVSSWLERPQVVILNPGELHWTVFRNLMETGQAAGAMVMDAHLAALAIENGAQLATTDRDFSRFAGLRVMNPLGT
jgi:toxin-antitoxin system PIN domain toxin